VVGRKTLKLSKGRLLPGAPAAFWVRVVLSRYWCCQEITWFLWRRREQASLSERLLRGSDALRTSALG
jgi:hypothetical protein